MVVGLGTGSTAAWFVKALAARDLSRPALRADLGKDRRPGARTGLTSVDAGGYARRIDLTVDGADEIGPGLALIKGGGAALLREKLVWEASSRCIVIADAAKVVPAWGPSPCRSRWSPSVTRPQPTASPMC
jgi:ribose 5-phosphate isomerase A